MWRLIKSTLSTGPRVLLNVDGLGMPGLTTVGGSEAAGVRALVEEESVAELLVLSAEVDGDVIPACLGQFNVDLAWNIFWKDLL